MGGRSLWRLREKGRRSPWRVGVKEKLEETLRELEKQGGEGLAIVCDVSKSGMRNGRCGRRQRAFGKLNVLVNNAGVLHAATIEGHQRRAVGQVADDKFEGAVFDV